MTAYRDKATNRCRYHFQMNGTRYSRRGFPTLQAARDAEADKRRELLSGRTDPFPTFRDLVKDFLAASERTKSGDWCYQLRVKLNHGFADLATLPPKAITTAHILKRLHQLEGAGRYNEYRKLAMAVFRYALKHKAVTENPVLAIDKAPTVQAEVRPIPTGHLQQLILAADGDLRPLLIVMSQTGARFVELQRLRVAECFLEGDRPYCVLTTRKNVGGHERKRPQPLSQLAVTALAPLLDRTDEYVFHGLGGGRISYDSELHRLHALCDRLNLPRYSFHQVRHWAGYAATAMGKSTKAVSQFLGHTNTKATERYLHAIDAEVWEVARRLEREMAALESPQSIGGER